MFCRVKSNGIADTIFSFDFIGNISSRNIKREAALFI